MPGTYATVSKITTQRRKAAKRSNRRSSLTTRIQLDGNLRDKLANDFLHQFPLGFENVVVVRLRKIDELFRRAVARCVWRRGEKFAPQEKRDDRVLLAMQHQDRASDE